MYKNRNSGGVANFCIFLSQSFFFFFFKKGKNFKTKDYKTLHHCFSTTVSHMHQKHNI